MTWLMDADVVAYSEERPRMRKNTENFAQHSRYIPIMFNLLNILKPTGYMMHQQV